MDAHGHLGIHVVRINLQSFLVIAPRCQGRANRLQPVFLRHAHVGGAEAQRHAARIQSIHVPGIALQPLIALPHYVVNQGVNPPLRRRVERTNRLGVQKAVAGVNLRVEGSNAV